ncbi:hypothetical protein CEXT_747771 [Caerostris extrusa]|uniref:Uncharacterized protein n=1 Tax=Caerostris extrusa TaxID=172846 RepID=A0AAV4T7C0_CAEEX|nr:hypothetical protein CEXT_747771 [Caerostris extrusa]
MLPCKCVVSREQLIARQHASKITVPSFDMCFIQGHQSQQMLRCCKLMRSKYRSVVNSGQNQQASKISLQYRCVLHSIPLRLTNAAMLPCICVVNREQLTTRQQASKITVSSFDMYFIRDL